MKSIVTHPAAYIDKQGKRPRFFIRIPSANLFLATKTQTDSGSAEAFVDKVQRLGTITEEINWLGGMGSVSGLDMESVELGQRVTLCDEVTIAPEPAVQDGLIVAGAGRLRWASPVYLTARNSTVGSFDTAALVIGRTLSEGAYVVNRAYIQFTLPAGITSCEEAVIELDGFGDYSDTDFNYAAVAGTFTTLDSTVYNDFTGWAASGDYTASVPPLVRYSGLVNSSEYSAMAKNKIRFDATGRTAVVTNTGGTLKVMILSYQDYTNAAAPTGDEFVQFVSSTARLKLRYNGVTLDNAEAEIYLDYEPVSTTYTAMQLLRKFIVDDYSIDDTSMTLRLRDNNFKHAPMIPGEVFKAADYPLMNAENIGKPKSLVYGDFLPTAVNRQGIAWVENQSNATQYSFRDYFVASVYENEEDGEIRAQISGHAIKQLGECAADYTPGITSYSLIAGDVTDAGTDKKQIVISANGAASFPYVAVDGAAHPLICYAKFTYSVAEGGVTNPGYCIDEDPTNYSTFDAGDYKYYYPGGTSTMPSFGASDVYTTGYICIKTEAVTTYDAGFKIIVYDLISPGEQLVVDEIISSDGWHYYPVTPINPEGLRTLAFRVSVTNLAGSNTIQVYGLTLCFGYQKRFDKEIYMSGKGRPDDGSGTITGTPSALLEIPAHAMESIARSEMALATANINTGSFDTSATTLAAWKSAFQITDRKEAPVHLDGMAKEAKSRVFWDYADTLKIKTFSSTAAFPVSGTDIPSGFDIFDRTGTPVSGSFTTNPIMPNSLEIGRIEKDEVYSDFVLHYKKNYASGEYGATLYMTNGLGVTGDIETNISESNLETSQTLAALKTLCAAAYTVAGATRTLDIKADFIRDTATATKYLQYLIERTTERRYTVSLTTRFNAVRHELGDFINVRDARLNDLFGEATVERKKWEITRMLTDLDSCEITIKAVEVD